MPPIAYQVILAPAARGCEFHSTVGVLVQTEDSRPMGVAPAGGL